MALLCGAAVAAFVEAVAPAPPTEVATVVAARDLVAGHVITPDDVRVIDLPPEAVPSHAAAQRETVVGEVVAAPMRAGEAITDRRLVAGSLVAGYPDGSVAAPVRVHDADVVGLLDVGDRVDVYTASPDRRDDPLLILDAPVVAIPTSDDDSAGGLVVLAVDGSAAARLAQHVAEAPLSVVLRD